jgi:pyruvate/2-oxoacid:ferredoxin oxidoreductase alpha subunit
MMEAQKDFIQERETKIIKGNVAAAYAAKSARVQVISAYPITPQTTVVEKLSEFVDNGEMPGTEYIKVESETKPTGRTADPSKGNRRVTENGQSVHVVLNMSPGPGSANAGRTTER